VQVVEIAGEDRKVSDRRHSRMSASGDIKSGVAFSGSAGSFLRYSRKSRKRRPLMSRCSGCSLSKQRIPYFMLALSMV
jgi:hypothetical protein